MDKHPDSEILLRTIEQQAQQDRQDILTQGQAQVEEIKAQAERALEELSADAQRQAEQALARERERHVSKLQAEQRLAVLDTKQRLLQHAFAHAEKEIAAVLQTPGYQKMLDALIRESLAVTGPDSRVKVAKAELALCQGAVKQGKLGCTVEATAEPAGTLRVISADGQRQVDNGLYTRLSRAQVQHASEVARILFREPRDAAGDSA